MSTLVTIERRDSTLLIGVNRPDKRNAWNTEIIQAVARAYTDLANDDSLRVGVLFGHGEHFTAGLDLMDVAPRLAGGDPGAVLPPDLLDPWDFAGEPCPKPVVLAVQGRCYTLGIELALASQVVVAASDTVFAQLEVARGIVPIGGATYRLGARLGARGLRWLLTGEEFRAQEAFDAGLVSEVVPPGTQLDRAIELANRIAQNAPLGVRAALASHRAAERAARDAAFARVLEDARTLFSSQDVGEAMAAMMERRPPKFQGR
jgi:enoyl-CoA hydratase/carnithine racemase